MIRAAEDANHHYTFRRIRELLQPLVDFKRWFDPRSDVFRWDMLDLHPLNDALHWGYPLVHGAGKNPLFAQREGRESFQ